MKKLIFYIVVLICILSCEDVLDKESLNSIDSKRVWESKDLTNLYLNNVYYLTLPHFAGISSGVTDEHSEASDESYGSGKGNMMYGLMPNDADYGIYGSSVFYGIRNLNVIIDEMENSVLEEEFRLSIKGQACFLRAWTYWELIKYYGGVPLILHAQDPYNINTLFPERSSTSDCINQIISDLDFAITNLPDEWPDDDRGRITRGAAAALKGRVLLYYASPQFNPDNAYPERWQDAYQANKTAKEMCEEDGYELYRKFEDIYIREERAKEAIFISAYDEINRTHNYEDAVRPRSVRNSNTPVKNPPNWDFVKSFPMEDGKPITGHPDYDQEYFWKNRDPRFYATIAYNACEWEFENMNGRIQWTYEGNATEPTQYSMGASPTGFYCRKNVNTDIASTETRFTSTDWIEIRLAEVYLNLAECAAEIGEIQEAKDLLILIRDRAGIKAGDDNSYGITASTSLEMVEAVMLERKIELAFEGKRHWDLRRRNMFINDLGNTPALNGTKRHGVLIELDTAYIMSLVPTIPADSIYGHFENVMADSIDFDKRYDAYFNTIYDVELDASDINYLQPKYNFYFIPTDALEKNENLQQTAGWGGYNTFDPLAD